MHYCSEQSNESHHARINLMQDNRELLIVRTRNFGSLGQAPQKQTMGFRNCPLGLAFPEYVAGWLAGTLENQLMVTVSAICAFSTWFWF
jgi:hypothetical protein